MANLYYAKKIEEIYFEAKRKHQNSLSLAGDIKMPVLKLIDLSETESSTVNLAQNVIDINQPIADNSAEETIIKRPKSDTKSDSIRIANSILEEINHFWTNEKIIHTKISEINSENAFNFIGYMITVSDTGTAIGDLRKYITSTDIKHITAALLRQAKNSGLVNIVQYSKLKNIHNEISKTCNINPYKKLDKKTIYAINSAIEEMYEELYKIS